MSMDRAYLGALLEARMLTLIYRYPFHLYIYLSFTPLDALAQNVGALDILLPDDSVTPLILQDAKMPPQNCDAEAMQAFRRASATSSKMRKGQCLGRELDYYDGT